MTDTLFDDAVPDPARIRAFSHSAQFRPFYEHARKTFFRTVRRSRYWAAPEDIDEALNEAMLDVFVEKPHTFKAAPQVFADPQPLQANLLKYLNRVACNKLNDRLAQTGKRISTTQSFDELLANEPDIDRLYHQNALYAPSAESDAERSSLYRALLECMDHLTELMRKTFSLALQGYTDVEIQARTQARSAGSVRRRISETRAVLQQCVQRKSGEESA